MRIGLDLLLRFYTYYYGSIPTHAWRHHKLAQALARPIGLIAAARHAH